MNPALCEKAYLTKAKFIENYGVDMHQVYGKDSRKYKLGLTPTGVLIYDGDEKIGLFFWPRIVKLEFTRAKLKIVVTEDDTEGGQQDHSFVFSLDRDRECKHLWKCAVEHHAFFRLVTSQNAPSKGQKLFRMKSRFYYSFRTEANIAAPNPFGSKMGRQSSRFQRTPSQRFSSRPSFAKQELEKKKLKNDERAAKKLETLERIEKYDSVVTPTTTPKDKTDKFDQWSWQHASSDPPTGAGAGAEGSDAGSAAAAAHTVVQVHKESSSSASSSDSEDEPEPEKVTVEDAQARLKGLEKASSPAAGAAAASAPEVDVNVHVPRNNLVKLAGGAAAVPISRNNLTSSSSSASTERRRTPVASSSSLGAASVIQHDPQPEAPASSPSIKTGIPPPKYGPTSASASVSPTEDTPPKTNGIPKPKIQQSGIPAPKFVNLPTPEKETTNFEESTAKSGIPAPKSGIPTSKSGIPAPKINNASPEKPKNDTEVKDEKEEETEEESVSKIPTPKSGIPTPKSGIPAPKITSLEKPKNKETSASASGGGSRRNSGIPAPNSGLPTLKSGIAIAPPKSGIPAPKVAASASASKVETSSRTGIPRARSSSQQQSQFTVETSFAQQGAVTRKTVSSSVLRPPAPVSNGAALRDAAQRFLLTESAPIVQRPSITTTL